VDKGIKRLSHPQLVHKLGFFIDQHKSLITLKEARYAHKPSVVSIFLSRTLRKAADRRAVCDLTLILATHRL